MRALFGAANNIAGLALGTATEWITFGLCPYGIGCRLFALACELHRHFRAWKQGLVEQIDAWWLVILATLWLYLKDVKRYTETKAREAVLSKKLYWGPTDPIGRGNDRLGYWQALCMGW